MKRDSNMELYTLPLNEARLHCIAKQKYSEVRLGVSHKGSMIVPVAEIKLYDSGKQVDAMACFEDAKKLGNAIVEAWNFYQNHSVNALERLANENPKSKI